VGRVLTGCPETWAPVANPTPARGAVHSVARGCKSLQMVAGACFGATKTDVVCFSLERILEPMAIPDICGHLLTADNLKLDQAKRRWRCRRCGRARAVEQRPLRAVRVLRWAAPAQRVIDA
jgi:DNA-directed RNA polymerase subunit RPC12/RpoP